MLLNGGQLDGTRILKKTSVDMMRTHVLSEPVLNSNSGIAQAVVFVGIIQRRGGVPGVTNHEDVSRRVIAEALRPGM